jgi:SM-20-related protein
MNSYVSNAHRQAPDNSWIDLLALHEYVVIDNVLTPELLRDLTALFEGNSERFEPAKIGNSQNEQRRSEIRSDFTYWLDKHRDVSLIPFFVMIEDWMSMISQELFLSLQDYEFHLALYPAGGFYKPHLDQFDTKSNRMISCVIYLNENWKKGDGGELKIHRDKEFIEIEPMGNRAVLFRSDTIVHEVLPSLKERRSLTGWLLKRPSGIGFLDI